MSWTMILMKAVGIWLVMLCAAMVNGVLREKILTPRLGIQVALPLSGLLLSALVFGITLFFIPFIGQVETSIYVCIGFMWVFMTLTFEIGLGHYVGGKPWTDVFQVFNLRKGDLFSLALVISMISPWLAAKIRGFL
jgi:hypothetical protein